MKIGDIIYVKHEANVLFRTLEILAETSRSWITAAPSTYEWIKDAARRNDPRAVKHYEVIKVPKNLKGFAVGTVKDAADAAWYMQHRYKVAKLAEFSLTPAQLLEVARLIGYTPLPEEPNVAQQSEERNTESHAG